jgi:alpha-glucosidase (family GH31 glycosyl hydrolase)
MPMMQFSVAPWRVLSKSNLAIVKQMVTLRKQYTPYILQLAKQAATTGEPIVRSMEYEFPNQGFAEEKGQFMLGQKYLIAPVLSKDGSKVIRLPKGRWKDDQGKVLTGPRLIETTIALNRLPVYELLSRK